MYKVRARSEMPYETRAEFIGFAKIPMLRVTQAIKQWKAKIITSALVEVPCL